MAFREESRRKNLEVAAIWALADPATRAAVENLDPAAAADDSADRAYGAAELATLLNSVLQQDTFYSVFETGEKYDWFPDIELIELDDYEKFYYQNRCLSDLDEKELRHFNCRVIEELLKPFGILKPSGYEFDLYLSRWLRELTGVGIRSDEFAKYEIGQWRAIVAADIDFQGPIDPKELTGFLAAEGCKRATTREDKDTLSRLIHPCFGSGILGSVQPPRQLSSGFHQVFPMIVQLGLMRWGDLIAIENPEVHLHPSMQLKLGEMLIAHARSGRRILVETHSDLLIRRVLRGILNEEISQSETQVYFADLKGIESIVIRHSDYSDSEWESSFQYSTLEPLQVDENGRIANWPEGFMDDDVRESQRLLDIMYGDPAAGGDDE